MRRTIAFCSVTKPTIEISPKTRTVSCHLTVGPVYFTFKCINFVEEIGNLNISNRWNTINKYYTRLDVSKSAMSTLRLAQLGTLTWRPSSLMKTPSHKDKYADNTGGGRPLCEAISSLYSTCTQRCGGMARPQTTGEQSWTTMPPNHCLLDIS